MNKPDPTGITFPIENDEQRARAIEKLDDLVDYVRSWASPGGQLLFLTIPRQAREANEHFIYKAIELSAYIKNGTVRERTE